MEEYDIEKEITELERIIKDRNFAKGTATTMTRVSGYVRAVENMNPGKQAEVAERLTYEVE
jgi:anaerobic ribonucleoside-triphosphate reductase